MRWIPALVAIVSALPSALFFGCASGPKLTGTERIAVVSYSLQRSITKSGESYDMGPILPSQKESYYKYHQESIDRAWAAFKVRAPSIFASRTLVDFASIEANAELKAATVSAPRKALGMDISEAGQRLSPAGMSYASLRDAAQNARIAEIAKADVIVAVDLKAEYTVSEGLTVGPFKGATAGMRLTAFVVAADASGKVIRRASVVGDSAETVTIAGFKGFDMDPGHEEYPRLILSAQDELLRNLAKAVARW